MKGRDIILGSRVTPSTKFWSGQQQPQLQQQQPQLQQQQQQQQQQQAAPAKAQAQTPRPAPRPVQAQAPTRPLQQRPQAGPNFSSPEWTKKTKI